MMPTYHGKPCKNCSTTLKYKVNWTCVQCHASRAKKRLAENPEQNKLACRAYYDKNRAHHLATSKRWRVENRERYLEKQRVWAKENAVYLRKKRREWIDRNPERSRAIRRAIEAARNASKIKATPAWADRKAIQLFYDMTPPGFHVDHVVPLRGTTVCGLHVLENLQYLEARANVSKGNRFPT